MHPPVDYPRHPAPFTSRTVLAAARVVADARADYQPGQEPPVDWEATIAFRRHLFSYGVGIAEAMDTSERGAGGLSWRQARSCVRTDELGLFPDPDLAAHRMRLLLAVAGVE